MENQPELELDLAVSERKPEPTILEVTVLKAAVTVYFEVVATRAQ